MELTTVIKFVIFLTTIVNEMLSVRNKIVVNTRNDCKCGEILDKSKDIIGSKITEPYAYPWQAQVKTFITKKTKTLISTCGGTVINNLYILTATNCVAMSQNIEVTLGVYNQNDINSKVCQSYKVKNRYFHEYVQVFNSQNGIFYINGIVLLKLNRTITYNKYIKPICLPNQDEGTEGKTGTVIGWGSTTPKFKGYPGLLKQYTGKVLTRKECEQRSNLTTYGLYRSTICFIGETSTCVGDEGGPLFYKTRYRVAVQIGVLSVVKNPCGSYPILLCSVTKFVDWIHNTTRDSTYCRR